VEEQIAIFDRSSIFLFPSISEGFGYAVLEAMSLGLAVVTTQTGLGSDYLRDGETASIVPFGSSLHLANAAVHLIKDSRLRSSIAKNGQLLSANFNNERFANEYTAAFEFYWAKKQEIITRDRT
jgi:glycosyltransferase involved in cell wall biosynthesis